MTDAKRQCLDLDEDLPVLPVDANPERNVRISIKIANMTAFANVIGSLRPAKKNPNEPQKEIIVIIQKNLPVCKESLTGKNVALIDGTLLSQALIKPFTGMVLVAVSNDRTRFSVAMMECDVQGLADGTFFKRAVVPHTLVKIIRGYKNLITANFVFKYEHYSMSQMSGEHGHILSETNSKLAYVEMDDMEDVREFFTYSEFEYCVRLQANTFLEKLRVMDGHEGFIALQELKPQNTPRRDMILTLSVRSDDFELQDSFTTQCGTDNVVNFCDDVDPSSKKGAAAKAAAVAAAAAAPKDDRTMDEIMQDAIAPSVVVGNVVSETMADQLQIYLKEFRSMIRAEELDHAKKDKSAAAKLAAPAALNKSLGQYRLICYRVLQSRTMMDLFQNLASEMQHGLMLLMANNERSPILMVLPVNEKTTIVHAMSCTANYEED
jgi:hypothetical protein